MVYNPSITGGHNEYLNKWIFAADQKIKSTDRLRLIQHICICLLVFLLRKKGKLQVDAAVTDGKGMCGSG